MPLLTMLASALLVAGCAFKTSTLDISYDEATASRGPLSSLESRQIQVAPVTDKRAVTAQIGHWLNKYNAVIGRILSRRPVSDIVQDALVVELKKNGHAVNSEEPDAVFSADINVFWADNHMRTTAMTVTVTDGRTRAPLLTREYLGVHRGRVPVDYGTGLRDAINPALQRMMRDLATDQKLVEALKRLPASR
jgi:uncharacterized lipoprotein YajG